MDSLKNHLSDLALIFSETEKKNIISVSEKKRIPLAMFIKEHIPYGYSYLAINGEVDMKFLKFHLSKEELRKLNPKLIEHFIKCVNDKVNTFILTHQNG